MSRILLAACAALLIACAPAQAAPAANFNYRMPNGGECIAVKPGAQSPAEVWTFAGTDTGLRLDDANWSVCPRGQLRIQPYEIVTMNAGGREIRTYMNRGQIGDADQGGGVRSTWIMHGHVHISDLMRSPTPQLPRYDASSGINGQPCPETSTIYESLPRDENGSGAMPQSWRYRPGGNSWDNYGVPSHTSGTPASTIPYTYLIWNWMWDEHSGGGQVRALVQEHQHVRRCDVSALTDDAFDQTTGEKVGEVRGVYVKVPNDAGTVLYGWMVHSYRYRNPDGTFQPWIRLLVGA